MQRQHERRGEAREPFPYPLIDIRRYLVEKVVPEVSAVLQKTYAEHQRARAERRTSPLSVMEKESGSIETTTTEDIYVDALIRHRLAAAFPDFAYLSEDSLKNAPDPRLKGRNPNYLRDIPGLWIVDSIDGSGRFANYSKRFSNSIALVWMGETVVAVVHKPMGEKTWWAQADEVGAYVNGIPIYVSETRSLDKATISTAYAWDRGKRSKNTALLHERISANVHQPALNTASSVLDLIEVADGRMDAHFSFGLQPWDMAAAALIIEKAGGRVTTLTGENWDPFCDTILATNGAIHDDLLDLINRQQTRFSLSGLKPRGLLFSGALHLARAVQRARHR